MTREPLVVTAEQVAVRRAGGGIQDGTNVRGHLGYAEMRVPNHRSDLFGLAGGAKPARGTNRSE